ncbi:hypothetical protein [Natrinema sp. DC36]|uniref:hypothetical protein n=1 Tax=Natrinema sp. DC36 TaxID=2878680 RepID=UPI001CEFF09E|nr:hypothetical protein [Natrinema sp. DC36]
MTGQEIERSIEEIETRIEVLRKQRDQFRELGRDEAADQRECAIIALKWILGEEIDIGERYQ